MNNNKGLTLIEVILSMAIIGLIASVFLPSMTSSLSMMIRAKDLTKGIFEARQKIEVAMEVARDRDTSKYDSRFHEDKSYNIFGKKIEGVLINQPISNNNEFTVFIPDNSTLEEPMPVIKTGTVGISPSEFFYGFKSGAKLYGENGYLEDDTNYYITLSNWYVSKPGFEGYVPDSIDNSNEGYFGTRYPSWPQDYIKIKNNSSQLTNLYNYIDDYKGRYIVFSQIPVSNIGKYGIEVPSKPVFLAGLPVLYPKIHLDVDTFQHEIYEEEGIEAFWEDILDKNIKTDKKIEFKYNSDNGKYAEFKNLKTTLTENQTMRENMTVFVVFSSTSVEESHTQNIITKYDGDKGLELKLSEGKVEFVVSKNKDNILSVKSEVPIDNSKHILVGEIIYGTNGKVVLYVDDEVITLLGDTRNYDNSELLSIGDDDSNLNLYEIIIYDSSLSDDEIEKVRVYLNNKHIN
ncbi:type II secretion system protein [Tissierella sp. Yu-01]|uniref:type II secretion system protein n=1 Tax=Tissierella sp. Yu-01 TaxID=3035694 RepID=UPI00240E450C|nr:type II secretion system protein [Tissierella sp. Yu-01]WFA09181.1 type II secretion system protein [Tissierella sp. Yu-01]